MYQDPNNNFAMMVDSIFRNVLARYYGQLTNSQVAYINQKWANDRATQVIPQLMQISQQRQGNLSQQEVDGAIDMYLKNAIQAFNASNTGMYQQPMMNNGWGNPMMQQPMFGMNNGFGFNNGFNSWQRPPIMGNMYGQAPMGVMPQAPTTGMMPSQTQSQMANMYDMKPAQPPMQQQFQTLAPQKAQAAAPQTKIQMPVITDPVTKIIESIAPFTEPTKIGSTVEDGVTIDTYLDDSNKKLKYITGTVSNLVSSVHEFVEKYVNKFKPNFMSLKYKTYTLVDTDFDALSKAFFEIKDVVQKADASDKEYTSFDILGMVLKTLDSKKRGISNFIEKLIVEEFKKYVYALNLGDGSFLVDTCDKIVGFGESIKDKSILDKIDFIVDNIVQKFLMNTVVYDPASKEMAPYLGNTIIGKAGTYAEAKIAEPEAFAKWAKTHSVLVSDVQSIIWTNLSFPDMLSIESADRFSVLSMPRCMDSSPSDCSLEFFVKTGKDYTRANLIISIDNCTVSYMVVPTEDSIYLRGTSLY